MAMISTGYRTKSAKLEKAYNAKSGGNQVQAFKSPLPVESHKRHFIPLAKTCDNRFEMLPTRKAHDRLSTQGFYLGLVT